MTAISSGGLGHGGPDRVGLKRGRPAPAARHAPPMASGAATHLQKPQLRLTNTLRGTASALGRRELLVLRIEQVDAGDREPQLVGDRPADAGVQLRVGGHARVGQGAVVAQVGVDHDAVGQGHRGLQLDAWPGSSPTCDRPSSPLAPGLKRRCSPIRFSAGPEPPPVGRAVVAPGFQAIGVALDAIAPVQREEGTPASARSSGCRRRRCSRSRPTGWPASPAAPRTPAS